MDGWVLRLGHLSWVLLTHPQITASDLGSARPSQGCVLAGRLYYSRHKRCNRGRAESAQSRERRHGREGGKQGASNTYGATLDARAAARVEGVPAGGPPRLEEALMA